MDKSKISIKNNIKYTDIEDSYNLITQNKSLNLYIPENMEGKQLGIFVELIQLIITWSRRCEKGKLYLNYDSTTEDIENKIDTMFRRYWNFVAGCMGYQRGIYLKDHINIESKVAKTLKERIEFIDNSKTWKRGNYEFIACVKHSLKPFPESFYNNGNLRSKGEFITLIDKILKSVILNSNINADLSLVEHNKLLIGEIVYELIENTHWWSLKDTNNIDYKTAIRGLIVANHFGNKELLLKNCRDDNNLIKYINDLNLIGNTNIIEISIFDSGPGLASKWKEKNTTDFSSNEEILETVIDCLIYGNTSSKNNDYQRGLGFYNVMKLLKNTGYLSIRTNGVKLFRNFIEQPFDSEKIKDRTNYKMNDWYSKNEHLKNSNISEGTVVSIFIPII